MKVEQTERVGRLINAILTARSAEQRRYRNYVYVSEVGKCIRQTYYKINKTPTGEEETKSDNGMNLVFTYGNMLESALTRQIQLAGPQGVFWQDKARVEHSGFEVSGETDPVVIWEGDKVVIEMKATHRKHFAVLHAKFMNGECDEGHYDQLQTYLHLYPEASYGVIWVANRDMSYNDPLPETIFLEVQRDEEWKVVNWERMERLKAARVSGVPPDREYGYNDWQCRYCPWRNLCWSNLTQDITTNDTPKPTDSPY